MAKFCKKPVVIEAWSVAELHDHAKKAWDRLPPQVVDAYEGGRLFFANFPRRIIVSTLEGEMTADSGDMLICGVQGELYPCKPDIFAATYEAVG